MTTMTQTADMPLIDKIRNGRQRALAGLGTRRNSSENIVPLYGQPKVAQEKADRPVFYSRRRAQPESVEPLILTNPVAA